jgi:hypothetical protein
MPRSTSSHLIVTVKKSVGLPFGRHRQVALLGVQRGDCVWLAPNCHLHLSFTQEARAAHPATAR